MVKPDLAISEIRRSYGFLLIAAALIWLMRPETTLPVAAWIAPIFLVRFWQTQPPLRAFLAHFIVCSGITAIAFQDVPPVSGLEYYVLTVSGVLLDTITYLIYRLVSQRIPTFLSTLVLPMACVSLEYLSSFQVGGTIMSIANTQMNHLPLAQIVSVVGIWGITFLIYWNATVINWLWQRNFSWQRYRVEMLIYASVLGLVLLFGNIQLTFAPSNSTTFRVAGISVNNLPPLLSAYRALNNRELPIDINRIAQNSPEVKAMHRAYDEFWQHPERPEFAPVRESLAQVENELFRLTRREAQAGAKMITWSEANAFVAEDKESQLVTRVQQLARAERIYFFMPIAVITPGQPQALQNKVLIFGPDGALLATYHKTKLAPGETYLPGDGTIPVIPTPYGKVAVVICYDADSPNYIRQVRQAGADLLLIPTGDWRAIASIHANAHIARAIENGLAIVRVTSNGLSIAADRQGRILAKMDYFKTSERVMVANVPTQAGNTLYTQLGDSFAWLCAIGTGIFWLIYKWLWLSLLWREKRKLEKPAS
jgi:apolipoprotein N-acyltransferase